MTLADNTNPNLYAELDAEGLLWHYTSWGALQGIVNRKAIWASHIRYLNDTLEYEHGRGLLKSFIEKYGDGELLQFWMHLETPCYVASFSNKFDSLGQWRAYAGTNAGLAIGFDREELQKLAPNIAAAFGECYYLGKDGSVKEALPELTAQIESLVELRKKMHEPDARRNRAFQNHGMLNAQLANSLTQIAARVKDESFGEEKEVRIVVPDSEEIRSRFRVWRGFHEKGSLVVPHLAVPFEKGSAVRLVRGILVGPSPHTDLVGRAIEMFFRNHIDADEDWKHVATRVAVSQVPFRNW